MKHKIFIAKVLTIGIVLNSLSVLSYANTEIPNRYQTLEGEYITIDDSTEGNLEEIEIFGNTVQDPNNLEDVQSVGDLYVDEDGNPILDSQGREQYKIDIVSSNSNLNYNNKFYAKSIGTFSVVDNGYKVENTHNQVHLYYDIPLNGSTEVTVKAKLVEKSSAYDNSNAVLEWYIDGQWSGNRIRFQNDELNYTISIPKTISDSKILTVDIAILKGDFDYGYVVFDDISLAYGDTTNLPFEKPVEYKTTILLPCQLQKVGNKADRLYWDDSKNRYIVEKNVGIIKDIRDYLNSPHEVFIDTKSINKLKGNYSPVILEGYKYLNWDYKSAPCVSHYRDDNYVRIYDDNFLNLNLNQAKEYVNDKKMYYQLKTPEYIETNITSKLKIPTYDGKTHIYVDSQNGINPTLKVTVDRLPQIAKEAVAQAESDSNNHNISLARMYTNMLPESSYKDQLQEQLSDIFSSDMVLDMKTATSNLDVYIKSENILQMSLDTNQISFEDFSGIEDVEKINAVNLTINSSLPYQINAYLPVEIQNADKTKTLDKSILNIKESSSSNYQTFTNTTDKIILKDNCSAGNQLRHGVDLKLAGGIAHEKDVYKATIKLEAEQK